MARKEKNGPEQQIPARKCNSSLEKGPNRQACCFFRSRKSSQKINNGLATKTEE